MLYEKKKLLCCQDCCLGQEGEERQFSFLLEARKIELVSLYSILLIYFEHVVEGKCGFPMLH